MNEYVSAGYYVVNEISRPKEVSEILPDKLLTISNCFAPVVRQIIQLRWDDYEDVREAVAEEATKFGILPIQVPDLVRWAKEQDNDNYVVYTNVETPLELRTRFMNKPETHVVGLGLHADLLSSFKSQLDKDVNKGLGLVELIEQERPLTEGGSCLGYEPLGFCGTSFHSWLCHYAPDEAFRLFGTRTNKLGLIDEFKDALRVNEHLLQTGCEPAIWEPWLIVDYAAR